MTPQELMEINRRVQRTTKGKWEQLVGRWGAMPRIDLIAKQPDGSEVFLCHFHQVEPKKEVNNNWGPDAEFIIHAAEDIQKLLAEVNRLRALMKGVA